MSLFFASDMGVWCSGHSAFASRRRFFAAFDLFGNARVIAILKRCVRSSGLESGLDLEQLEQKLACRHTRF